MPWPATTVTRISTAEQLAKKGDVLADEATVNLLGASLVIREWRHDPTAKSTSQWHLLLPADPTAPVMLSFTTPFCQQTKAWINPTIYEREQAGQESFLTEFRPCIAMFVRFGGIDYDFNEAEEQLDTFIRQIQACAEHDRGTLLQLTIGDKGSYAYINFGAFSTHEDDARRAVKTALDLKKAPRDWAFWHRYKLELPRA